AAALPECGGRLAGSLIPPALARPFAHRQSGEERPGRSPADVVRRVVDVPANERVHVVRKRWVAGQPEGDEQRSRLARHERTRTVMLIRSEVRRRALELDRARRGGVGDARTDRVLDTRRNPRLVDQSIEPRRLVEHLSSLLADPAFSSRGGYPRLRT